MTDFTTVARTEAITEGTGQAFAVNGRMVAVFYHGGEYFAIDDFCPHMGASLAGGPIDDGVVACPWHFWRFRLRDGAWMDNPNICVDSFDVRVLDGEIQVRVPPKDSQPPNSGGAGCENSPESPDRSP